MANEIKVEKSSQKNASNASPSKLDKKASGESSVSATDSAKKAKNRQLRFKPDEGSVAWIDSRRSSSSEEFLKQYPALIVNESFDGCALICLNAGPLKKGSKLWLEVGLLAPMQAEVMWVEKLSQDAVKFGAKYL